MRVKYLILCLAICGFALARPASSYTLVNANASPATVELFNYLASQYGKHTITGFSGGGIHAAGGFGDIYTTAGKHEAIVDNEFSDWWGSEVTPASMTSIVNAYQTTRPILTFQWHWMFEGQSAWAGQRTTPVNVGNVVTPGTQEYTDCIADLSRVADDLQVLKNANIPVLFRPLHEIDGGWFWWTDSSTPAHTVALWQLIYNYMTVTRGLNNIIWVWSSGQSVPSTAFYPGMQYVDIIGSDPYGRNYQDDRDYFWQLWNALSALDGSKMITLAECGAIPNPDLMKSGATPTWLYALPWFGIGPASQSQNSIANDLYNWRNPFMITEEQLPKFSSGSGANLAPEVGILSPLDDGSGRFVGTYPVISVFANDRDGTISHVDYYANSVNVGTVTTAPYTFTWKSATPGTYKMQAVAYDKAGASANSQTVRISYNVADLALNSPVTTSDGSNAAAAVDGTYWTNWVTADSVTAWAYVDFGVPNTINEVDLSFVWKVFADQYTIDVSNDGVQWTTVAAVKDDGTGNQVTATLGNVYSADEYPMKAYNKVTFSPVTARYVRFSGIYPIQYQTWAGYNFTQIEVPVAVSAVNHAPVISTAAWADASSFYDYTTNLHVVATDPDRDYLTYSWSVMSGAAANVSFTVNNSVLANNTTINVLAAGVYTVQVTVTDGRGGSATSQVTVTQQVINGAMVSDDCDSQGGAVNNGPQLPAKPTAPISQWAQYGLRCILQKGITVQHASLWIYVSTSTPDLHASLYSGSTDNWNSVTGPVPTEASLLQTAPINDSGGSWLQFDVTLFVIRQAKKDGIASFVLAINDAPGWQSVFSMAYADPMYRPHLDINPLSVSLSAPKTGAVYVTAPASITMTAVPLDSDGAVTQVDFYNGTTLLGTATSSPFSYTWTNAGVGMCHLTAVATDDNDVTATSGMVSVRVNASPTVSLTGPANNQVYTTVPATITLTATAADSDGKVARVSFYNGATWIGSSTTSPYSVTWTKVPAGSFSLHAVAVDNNSAATSSNVVSVRVNTPPTVKITSPASGKVYAIAPASIVVTASASVTYGKISKVDFYNGSTLLGTSTASPYSYTWTKVPPGTYNLTAVATDISNNVTTSSVVTTIVNAPPLVSLSAPTTGHVYSPAPATITFTAVASDPDGTVREVAFYNGGVWLGTVKTSPYTFTWSNVRVGSYNLHAAVTDNYSATATSNVVSVQVTK